MTDQTLKDIDRAFKALEERDELLDKIRAEIRSMDYLTIEDGSDGYDYYINRDDVLAIIDKCKAEGSDKE